MSTLDELRSQALELPPAHRAGLARDLLMSLEPGEASTDSDTIDVDWADEIRDRAEAVASGNFSATDWRDSVERLRNELAQRRAT